MTKMMNEETWIKSRTNNPDRLGKDVWSNFYRLALREAEGSKTLSIANEALKPLHKKMAKEYLDKLGLSAEVTDSNLKYILGFMKTMDSDQNPEAMKIGLEAVLRMGKKSSLTDLLARLSNKAPFFKKERER
ncbi:MAG: hypothetical protein ACI4OR_00965 [Alphaproteobacteria bacterium]